MTTKKPKYVSIHLPSSLISDIEDFLLLNKKSNQNRSAFIIGLLNDYLDEQYASLQTFEKKKLYGKQSLRAQRHNLNEVFWDLDEKGRAEMLETLKKISKQIEEAN